MLKRNKKEKNDKNSKCNWLHSLWVTHRFCAKLPSQRLTGILKFIIFDAFFTPDATANNNNT